MMSRFYPRWGGRHLRLVLIVVVMNLSVNLSGVRAQIIIDHNCTDISKIPDYWIEQVKKMTVIHTGESHGRQVPYGLMDIETDISGKYDVEISNEGIPPDMGALRISRALRTEYNLWMLYPDTIDFWDGEAALNNVRRTLDYHIANGDNVDVILHTWSWDFGSEADFDKVNRYFLAMETLEVEYPNVTFVYITDATNEYGDAGYNRWRNHEVIRQYVGDNNKTLFDFGELETWSADGTVQNSYYHSGSGENIPYAHNDWEVGGLGYEGPTGEGGCHIGRAACTMKAKAFWWLMARLAGWDGIANPDDSDFNVDCRINMLDSAVFANAWSADSNSPNWNELCDIAPGGGDGVVNYKDLAVLLSAWLQAWDRPPAIISTPVTEVIVGQLYTYRVYATGCPKRTYALTTFPAGMTIDAVTGLIEWIPVAVGDVNVVVEATNLEGTDTQVFTINVTESPRIENLSLTSTSGNNLVTDDLCCRYDLAGGAITAATAWYKDESPLMALYMPFEGGETKALLDVSGYGVTVTVGGKPTWNPAGDHNGNGAYEFDGYSDYISADSICADVAGRDFTIMCWIRSDYSGSAQQFIASFNTSTGDNRLLLGHPANSSDLAIYDNGWHYTNASVIDGVYHFVGYVLSDSKDNITVYVDGESVHSFTTGASVASDDLFSIGQEYDLGLVVGDFFDGLVGELMIYKHALSPEQVSSLYNGNGDLIVSGETEDGDTWQACVTPFSSTGAGAPYCSNTLTIRCYNGDFNGDCTVDFFDLAVFADAWSAEPGSPNWNDLCDVAPGGGDGVVSYKDLAVFCDEWLVGIGP